MTISWRRSRLLFLILILPGIQAANLKPETTRAWEEYLQETNIHVQQRLSPGKTFLWMDEVQDRVVKVKANRIVVAPAGPHIPKKVPSGLIHHWIGVGFMPKLTIRDVLAVLRDYGRYKEFYRPNVIDSKVIDLAPDGSDFKDRFETILINKAFFKKTALDSDYEASYFRLDDHRLYTVSRSTHIREIAEFGAPGQHTLPEDEGTGLIWRLFTVIRFEEREGGLFIEVEAVALSRDIPAAVRVMADPIVRRVSRDALITALKQTEAAVRSSAMLAAARESH
jgi:hypothetical protein